MAFVHLRRLSNMCPTVKGKPFGYRIEGKRKRQWCTFYKPSPISKEWGEVKQFLKEQKREDWLQPGSPASIEQLAKELYQQRISSIGISSKIPLTSAEINRERLLAEKQVTEESGKPPSKAKVKSKSKTKTKSKA